MKIYLSLPITGYKLSERKEYAARQAAILREVFDCVVFNPLEDVSENDIKPYEYYMGKDLYALSRCDTIIFCPGWGSSRGCKIEYFFAANSGHRMLEMTDEGHIVYNEHIYDGCIGTASDYE